MLQRLLYLFTLVFSALTTAAQIPQDIRVQGDPEDSWLTVLIIFGIVIALMALLVYFRYNKKK
ncbi:MAG: hypothetical protein EA392_07785 [Cryomorphaceae bacterium]|nr:MAG: hypothetical protein EA392_07785 [Cryomorphaceae bacterium]